MLISRAFVLLFVFLSHVLADKYSPPIFVGHYSFAGRCESLRYLVVTAEAEGFEPTRGFLP